GTLNWVAPVGNWTIMRFGSRNNGAVTRPAPVQGLGFEADKFDTVALNAHLEKYVGTILNNIGTIDTTKFGG
ncbi:glycosyl hydrolase, partial [Streptomyces sp. UMAF16]|nr:glycosyl hydrolase [Streptomyces sp. UMAF16]